MMKAAGATAVGLGACRLRVETATIALLSTLMLWSDAKTCPQTRYVYAIGLNLFWNFVFDIKVMSCKSTSLL